VRCAPLGEVLEQGKRAGAAKSGLVLRLRDLLEVEMSSRLVADLRSDTVTQATPEMRKAMAEAVVGDDGREDDPTARRLEEMAAALTGQEAGLFCTSGTMGNLVALMTHLQPGEEVIAERDSHFLRFESGGCTAVAGAIPRTLVGRAGRMDLEELEREIQAGSRHRPRTALIVAENTHNLAGGTCLDVEYMQRLWEMAQRHGRAIHLDGARVCNAAVALGVPVAELTRGCQSVMVDLSKGLCAPYGSLLCGSAEFIARARLMRQRVGGGVRQIGHMAACGIIALERMVDRLAEDHANARLLAEGIAALRRGLVSLELVQTNIVNCETGPLGVKAADLCRALEARGVRCLPMDAWRVRFVTHRDVTREVVEYAVGVIGEVVGPTGR
jgi:threonine aldolase